MTTDTLRPYRPYGAVEGEAFKARFCRRCKREGQTWESEPCPILVAAELYDTDEPGYPREWVQDESGPRCTAFDRDALKALQEQEKP